LAPHLAEAREALRSRVLARGADAEGVVLL
jgi:hypothetical protein